MQLGDAGTQLVEVGDLPVELGESGGEQLLDVVAGSLAASLTSRISAIWAIVRPAFRPRRMKSSRWPASGG